MIWFWLRPLLAASVTAVNVVVTCLLHRWWSGHGRAGKQPPFTGIVYGEGHGWPPPGSRGTPSSFQLYQEWQASQTTDAFSRWPDALILAVVIVPLTLVTGMWVMTAFYVLGVWP